VGAKRARFLGRDSTGTGGALGVAQDKNLRQGPAIRAQQGPNRVARAQAGTDAMVRAAVAQGLRPRITFDLMDNCGHSFSDCVANGSLAQTFIPAVQGTSAFSPMSGQPQYKEVA